MVRRVVAAQLRLPQRGQAEQLRGFGGPLEPPHLPRGGGYQELLNRNDETPPGG